MKRPTKEQMRELPLFVGISLDDIVVVDNMEGAEKAIKELQGSPCLGFDTESKPCFRKGEVNNGPHLIQLANEAKAFLFPTRFLPIITALEEILSAPHIKKVGFGLAGDKKILQEKFGINLSNEHDLSVTLKRYFGLKQRVGIKTAVAMVFKQRLAKGAQTSNWAAFPLQDHQLKYAANDAYASLCIELAIDNAMKSKRKIG
ncbi:MAG: 3'-5' exonuclease [Candidatus Electrothrix aestuarii]|uniref:3'-5' exonuclease n=1 Tax=Candidatus Electrothrix aestuarii TaxID=3062594 RepID=A0AAU8LWF6_9BACT|nr:3'-5' exonuclease [Candidatus Electrothrix aestuarii]